MRAALLPAGADPFLIAFWLRHYRAWAGEVDELRVQVSGLADEATRKMLADLAATYPNVTMTFSVPRVDHGEVIARLLSETTADLVMLVEDDAFIRRPGVVEGAFRRIETGETDIVASPRATGTPEIINAASRAFGWQTTPSGEAGPFMWPCFLFARRVDLLATDGNFSVKRWAAGDPVNGLDVTLDAENAADTFGDASIQLLARGLRVHWDSQYRADEALMDGWHGAPWFHVGSLSASTDYLINKRLRVDYPAWVEDVRTSSDWVKRISWWLRVSEGEEAPEYRAEIAALVRDAGIPQAAIDAWTRRFDPFVTWQ